MATNPFGERTEWPDGSWRDTRTGRWSLSEEVIQAEYPEWEWEYIRKWNNFDPENENPWYIDAATGYAKGIDMFTSAGVGLGQTLDEGFETLFGWAGYEATPEEEKAKPLLVSHVEGDAVWTSSGIAQDVVDTIYKVLHSGFSLIFSIPSMTILTALNKESANLDPMLKGDITLRSISTWDIWGIKNIIDLFSTPGDIDVMSANTDLRLHTPVQSDFDVLSSNLFIPLLSSGGLDAITVS